MNHRPADLRPHPILSRLVGESEPFMHMLRMMWRMAAVDSTVLIQGETGTGKELVARAIHYLGARRDSPFLPLNCGAIPDSLVESELFGHARGAFTDARDERPGVIAQAEGGTLFLDEVEALSAKGQVALLRFLQDREYRPVGGSVTRAANLRVLAASNVDLETVVRSGAYRSDLLYRLEVFKLELPPLRARGDDVVRLAQGFVAQFCREYERPMLALAPRAIDFLVRHPWPGNVRQLENLIRRAVVLCDGPTIELDETIAAAGPVEHGAFTASCFRDAKAVAIARFERAYICELLARTRGNITLAARLSGKERSRLTKLVKKHGLDRGDFAGDGTPG